MSDTVDTEKKCGVGNTKSSPRCRFWFFTWNNYPENFYDTLTQGFGGCQKYVFQSEIGKNGTPHIQGTVGFKNARSLESLKKINNTIHWEKCKSAAADKYCSKNDTFTGKRYSYGLEEVDPPEIETFRPWQASLFEELSVPADKRTVLWYVDTTGAAGKTTFCKHICRIRNDALYVCGKANDMKHAVAAHINDKKKVKILFIDLVRSSEGRVSYEGIESLKNGIFFSGKYESAMVVFPCPHVVIFANFEPNLDSLSSDRWKVRHLEAIAPPGASCNLVAGGSAPSIGI